MPFDTGGSRMKSERGEVVLGVVVLMSLLMFAWARVEQSRAKEERIHCAEVPHGYRNIIDGNIDGNLIQNLPHTQTRWAYENNDLP